MASGQNDVFMNIKSETGWIDLPGDGKKGLTFFEEFQMTDSILDFYPLCEMLFPDRSGLAVNGLYFTEGLKFEIQMGYIDSRNRKQITGNYFWSDAEMNEVNIHEYISGDLSWLFDSYSSFLDTPKSKSWASSTNMEDVVKEIADDFELTTKPLFNNSPIGTKNTNISKIKNIGNWYQANKTNKEFLQTLRKYAYSMSSPYDVFFTFINLQNEFHFSSLTDLFAQNTINSPDQPYSIGISKQAMAKGQQNILDYQVYWDGFPTNIKNYRKHIYHTDDTGSFVKTISKYSNYNNKTTTKRGVRAIRKNYYSGETNTRDFPYAGIIESSEKELLKGYINYLNFDSILPYKLSITIPFNPDAVAGRLIYLEISNPIDPKKLSSEFSGKWLIIQSTHAYNQENDHLATELILGRNSIEINTNHPFKAEFE